MSMNKIAQVYLDGDSRRPRVAGRPLRMRRRIAPPWRGPSSFCRTRIRPPRRSGRSRPFGDNGTRLISWSCSKKVTNLPLTTFGSMHFEGSKNLIEEAMCSKRNSLERIFLGSGGDIVLELWALMKLWSDDTRRRLKRDQTLMWGLCKRFWSWSEYIDRLGSCS